MSVTILVNYYLKEQQRIWVLRSSSTLQCKTSRMLVVLVGHEKGTLMKHTFLFEFTAWYVLL
jgi:hypothetical protein